MVIGIVWSGDLKSIEWHESGLRIEAVRAARRGRQGLELATRTRMSIVQAQDEPVREPPVHSQEKLASVV